MGFSNAWLDIVHMSEGYLQPERTLSRRGRRFVKRGDCYVSHWGMNQQLINSFFTLSCTGRIRGVKGVQGVSMKSGRFSTSTHHQQSLVHATNASCIHLLEFLMLQNDMSYKYHRRLWVWNGPLYHRSCWSLSTIQGLEVSHGWRIPLTKFHLPTMKISVVSPMARIVSIWCVLCVRVFGVYSCLAIGLDQQVSKPCHMFARCV